MPKIIVCTNLKGGVGKSTLSINLAHAFKDNARTVIVDLDSQGSVTDVADKIEGVAVIPYSKMLSKEDVDYIIIDTPPYISDKLPDAYAMADLILIPFKAGVLDFIACSKTVSMVVAAMKRKSSLKAGFVMNMVDPSTNITEAAKDALADYHLPILKAEIGKRTDFSRSVSLANGIYDGEIKKTAGKGREDLSRLATEVLCMLH
jgi:chromosome partitioning protein